MISCKKKQSDQTAIRDEFNFKINQEFIKVQFFDVLGTEDKHHLSQLELPQYLSIGYLKLYESAGLEDTIYYYGLIKNSRNELIGVCLFQVKDFNAANAINWKAYDRMNAFQKLKTSFQKRLANQIQFTCLVIGNLAFTGDYGLYLKPEYQNLNDQILGRLAEEGYNYFKLKHPKLKAVFAKDYYQHKTSLEEQGFSRVEIQPAMQLALHPNWGNLEDYLAALKSKYRVRYRKARKRREGVQVHRYLGSQVPADIVNQLYDLYKGRADHASFNIAMLSKEYFKETIAILQDDVVLQTYCIDNKLVAFMLCVKDGDTLHAQFTGFEDSLNTKLDLYLNLLYDVVDIAIEQTCNLATFARTAMEIKSSIGAEPRTLFCYIKYYSNLNQNLVGGLVNYLEPKSEWKQRRPFKS